MTDKEKEHYRIRRQMGLRGQGDKPVLVKLGKTVAQVNKGLVGTRKARRDFWFGRDVKRAARLERINARAS